MEKIKRTCIKKWIKQYQDELTQVRIVCTSDEIVKLDEILGDLLICEKVFDSLFNFIDS